MRKVMIVVPVLMVSCHVCEKSNTGPQTAHAATVASATANDHGDPTAAATLCANRRNMVRSGSGAAPPCEPRGSNHVVCSWLAGCPQRIQNDSYVDRLLQRCTECWRQRAQAGDDHRRRAQAQSGPDTLLRYAHRTPGHPNPVGDRSDGVDEDDDIRGFRRDARILRGECDTKVCRGKRGG